jgi:hypothetical protein
MKRLLEWIENVLELICEILKNVNKRVLKE